MKMCLPPTASLDHKIFKDVAFSSRNFELLKQRKIITHLTVTPVKTYKDAAPKGPATFVHADELLMTS